MLAMMFKLAQCAQKNWRKQRGFKHLAKVINLIKDGIEVRTSKQVAA
jgi:putative transposase